MLNYLDSYRRLLALSDAGLLYGKDPFDRERYQEIKEISLSLMSQLGEEPLEKIKELIGEEKGYPTPKIDVRAYIKKKDTILLVQDIKTKEWSLPGGFAEVGFSPKENVSKEVAEETGLRVKVMELIGLFDTNLRKDIPQLTQYYKLVFSCEVVEGSFKSNAETSQFAYFRLDELPQLSEKRTTKEQLEELEKGDFPILS